MHTLKVTDIAPDGVVPAKFELTLDGFQIKGVTKYSITRLAGRIAAINLELNVAMDLGDKSGVADITHLGSTSREYSTGTDEGFEQELVDVPERPAPPAPPLGRIVREGSIGSCPACGSSEKRSWLGFGKVIGCIQPQCDRYYRFSKGGPIRHPLVEGRTKSLVKSFMDTPRPVGGPPAPR